MVESVHNVTWLIGRVNSVLSTLATCAPVRAAHSSKRGMDCCFFGATLDRAVMKAIPQPGQVDSLFLSMQQTHTPSLMHHRKYATHAGMQECRVRGLCSTWVGLGLAEDATHSPILSMHEADLLGVLGHPSHVSFPTSAGLRFWLLLCRVQGIKGDHTDLLLLFR